ncbi:MAG: DUF2784 domain-containing protein [Acidimicrobiales bacterium]
MNAILAVGWPVAHVSLIVFLIVGAPLGITRPLVARLHLVAAVATGTVFALGADCPFTVWEKSARSAAGWPVYRGGFVEHYLVQPVYGGGMTPLVTTMIMAAWLVPSLVGHGIRLRRRRHPANPIATATAPSVSRGG